MILQGKGHTSRVRYIYGTGRIPEGTALELGTPGQQLTAEQMEGEFQTQGMAHSKALFWEALQPIRGAT